MYFLGDLPGTYVISSTFLGSFLHTCIPLKKYTRIQKYNVCNFPYVNCRFFTPVHFSTTGVFFTTGVIFFRHVCRKFRPPHFSSVSKITYGTGVISVDVCKKYTPKTGVFFDHVCKKRWLTVAIYMSTVQLVTI